MPFTREKSGFGQVWGGGAGVGGGGGSRGFGPGYTRSR